MGGKNINKILAGPKGLGLVEPSRTIAQGKTLWNQSFRGAFREQLTEAGEKERRLPRESPRPQP